MMGGDAAVEVESLSWECACDDGRVTCPYVTGCLHAESGSMGMNALGGSIGSRDENYQRMGCIAILEKLTRVQPGV